ncbi:hypothetical protein Trydic_g11301 [Trypoxylus dichotomus]
MARNVVTTVATLGSLGCTMVIVSLDNDSISLKIQANCDNRNDIVKYKCNIVTILLFCIKEFHHHVRNSKTKRVLYSKTSIKTSKHSIGGA